MTQRKFQHDKEVIKNDLKDIVTRTPTLSLLPSRDDLNVPATIGARTIASASGTHFESHTTQSLPAIASTSSGYYSNSSGATSLRRRRPRTIAGSAPTKEDLWSNLAIKTSTKYRIRRASNISRSLTTLYDKISKKEARFRREETLAQLEGIGNKGFTVEHKESFQMAKIVLKNSKFRSLVDSNYDPTEDTEERDIEIQSDADGDEFTSRSDCEKSKTPLLQQICDDFDQKTDIDDLFDDLDAPPTPDGMMSPVNVTSHDVTEKELPHFLPSLNQELSDFSNKPPHISHNHKRPRPLTNAALAEKLRKSGLVL